MTRRFAIDIAAVRLVIVTVVLLSLGGCTGGGSAEPVSPSPRADRENATSTDAAWRPAGFLSAYVSKDRRGLFLQEEQQTTDRSDPCWLPYRATAVASGGGVDVRAEVREPVDVTCAGAALGARFFVRIPLDVPLAASRVHDTLSDRERPVVVIASPHRQQIINS